MSEERIPIAIEAENGTIKGQSQVQNQCDLGEKIAVNRKRINSVTIYEVSEDEITILEKGPDSSVWLNFFIGSLSIALSFLITLTTVPLNDSKTVLFLIFLCLAIISFFFAIISFVFWHRGKKDHRNIINKIKGRAIQE